MPGKSPLNTNPPACSCSANVHGPKALIFDCDGTLADTMPLHWRCWQVIARRHKFTMAEDKFYALGGVPTREIVRLLSEEQGVELDAITIAREKELAYLDLLAEVEPISCVVAIARQNFGKVPMAVATGGTRRVIEQVLAHLGIKGLFDTVVTADDVVRPKPAPDVFLEAARRLGVPPQFCRAYEDADVGIEAIRAAGMEAVDVRDIIAAQR